MGISIACDAFRVAKRAFKVCCKITLQCVKLGQIWREVEGDQKLSLVMQNCSKSFLFLDWFQSSFSFSSTFYTLPTFSMRGARSRFFSSNGQKKRGYAYNFIHRFNFAWQTCVRFLHEIYFLHQNNNNFHTQISNQNPLKASFKYDSFKHF